MRSAWSNELRFGDVWSTRSPHQAQKIFRSRSFFHLNDVLRHLRPVGLGCKARQAPRFDVAFQTRLEAATHCRDVASSYADARLAVPIHRRLSRCFVGATPGALSDAFQLFAVHVAKDFVVD